jgi:hypothetical protein
MDSPTLTQYIALIVLYRNGPQGSAIFHCVAVNNVAHSLTHGAEPFLRSNQLCSYSRNSHHFMESEGSLRCPQQPSTGPYSEPDESNPYHLILPL